MFDQSFSEQNLFKIYSSENNKGNNLAVRFFPNVSIEYEYINRVRKLLRRTYSRKRFYSRIFFENRVLFLYRLLRHFKERKRSAVRQYLKIISNNISNRSFNFVISKSPNKVNGKDVYVTGSSADSFFSEKQIQRNIKYTYGVKQADRDLIIPQLRSVLDDSFPKIIIKTDIKSFYESINRDVLLKKLNESPILSLTTRKLIARLFKSYESVSGATQGIPRGVGVSAYLSELYLKKFDLEMESLPNLIYYARYVDDIVLVLTPQAGNAAQDFLINIESQLEKECLELNKDGDKTKVLDLSNGYANYSFDYLGYRFNYSGGRIRLELSSKKIIKYQKRILDVINAYKRNVRKQPKKARREFLLRIKFLTYNTKLSNNKGNAVVGIYNSNQWITNSNCLEVLDRKLIGLSRSLASPSLEARISKYSFKKGFDERLFANFTAAEFTTITKVWS